MNTHVPSAPVGTQMARDGLELMTQEQRLALAMEIVVKTTLPGCTQHLLRLANQARSISDEITGNALIAQFGGRS